MTMWTGLTAGMAAIIGFFSDVFTMVTDDAVLPWIILGVAVPLISFLVGLFKRIVWGRN